MDTPKRPGWSDEDISKASAKVGQDLRKGVFSDRIQNAQNRCRGKTWWERQWNPASQIYCSELKTIRKRIEAFQRDAPRVLRKARDQWRQYAGLVLRQHGEKTLEEIVEMARESPAEFYIYLVTVHVQASMSAHKPGMEASVSSAYAKIGSDNQFLWSKSEYKKTFVVAYLDI